MTQQNSTRARGQRAIRGAALMWWLVACTLQLGFTGCALAKEAPPAPSASQVRVEPAAEAAVLSEAKPSDAQEQGPTERRVIHKAELSLASEDVRATADQAVGIATSAGGYLARREERHSENHVVQSQLSLRVPALHFERVLGELKGKASVVQERVTGDDVTEEFSDVAARIRALTTLENRLLALTTSRDAVKDLLEVERELQRVRSEIERFSGRKQWLENQTAFATIDLGVSSPDQPVVFGTESVWSRFANAFSDGIDESIDVVAGLIRVGFTLAPLVPLAVCGLLVYRAMRRRRLAARI